jgi:EAL domain-containing protein (putative c-di-GMP-specific phosphodiesterase class I)
MHSEIGRRRLVLYEQPILNLRTDEVWCHELLIRMLDPRGRLVPPTEFIPMAERLGLIGEIDRWVTGEALKRAQTGRRVTINISAQSLTDRSILSAVRDAVDTGMDPRNVIFEITETAPVPDVAEAVRVLTSLAEVGCDLALDDFGAGYGSLTNLRHFPARFLKIDASFVRNVLSDTTDRLIVQMVCGIARALGKETIAEGVEDDDTLTLLRALGVDHAQGFLIGRPGPYPCASQARGQRPPAGAVRQPDSWMISTDADAC